MGKKLLQINVTANWGSTGRIVEQIGQMAIENGWESYIAYGRHKAHSKSILIKVGSILDVYEHFFEYYFFDNDGLASRRATKKLIQKIEEIQPDIIHLHNIHDHWLNYKILFEYLNTLDTPIVWTQHDCWAFTGDCGYFTKSGCEQWKKECTENCAFRANNVKRKLLSHSTSHYLLKRRLFSLTKNLQLVTVSHWQEKFFRNSFLKDKYIQTIYNGVDTKVFRHLDNEVTRAILDKYGLGHVSYIVGVASVWEERKGFNDYCMLAPSISKDIKIVLVGLDKQKIDIASRYGIIGIPRTDNVEDLVAIYNGATIVMNLSYEETFGLTTVEGFACGTPSIVYNATASPELITRETGRIVKAGDIPGIVQAIKELLLEVNSQEIEIRNTCRNYAVSRFDNKGRFLEYFELYHRLLTIN